MADGRRASLRRLPEWLPVLLLGAAGLTAAALILFLTRDANFFYDEWIWFSGAAHMDGTTLFKADNGHLVLVPRLIYGAVLAGIGTHYRVFQMIDLVLVLAIVAMFFALARRRVGDWLALPPAILLLCLGSAWDVLASGIGINVNIAIACGLGAFIALERRNRIGDLLACGLLLVGVGSFSGALAIATGCAVLLLAEARWRRLWVAAVPIMAFGIWGVLTPDRRGASQVTLEQLGNLPLSMFDSAASAMAAATGLFAPETSDFVDLSVDVSVGRPLAAVAIILFAFLSYRSSRVTPRFLAYLTAAVVLWVMIAAVGRPPAVSRYNLQALPFLFLAAFELVRGRPGWRWTLVLGLVVTSALLANLVSLRNGAAILRYSGERDRAILAALELQPQRPTTEEVLAGRPISHPGNTLASDLIYITPPGYLAAANEFGSAAYSLDELAGAPEYAREFADQALVHFTGVGEGPVLPGTSLGHDCSTIRPRRGDPAWIRIPPGGFALRGAARTQVSFRRYADVATAGPFGVSARGWRVFTLPPDRSPMAWKAEVGSSAPVRVCPLR